MPVPGEAGPESVDSPSPHAVATGSSIEAHRHDGDTRETLLFQASSRRTSPDSVHRDVDRVDVSGVTAHERPVASSGTHGAG